MDWAWSNSPYCGHLERGLTEGRCRSLCPCFPAFKIKQTKAKTEHSEDCKAGERILEMVAPSSWREGKQPRTHWTLHNEE